MKIAIAGYGVEGRSSYEYYSARGHSVTILDEREVTVGLPVGVPTIFGPHAFDNLEEFDMVIRTPSIPPKRLASAKKIWSETNEFFAECPAPIVGVTGTKGKGTTSSLIAAILRTAGKTVHLVGNIGVPALSVLVNVHKDDIVVYELSSFQLWDLESSPHIAVVLMIEPDHLNVHADFDDYVIAKANIATHQHADDIFIYHPSNQEAERIAHLSSASTKRRYLTSEAAYIQGGHIRIDEQSICSVEKVSLKGDYNLENVCAAISVAWFITQDISSIAKAVTEFKGLEHRLEFVANRGGIDFYNDSYSSAPTATIAAITAFTEPLILIVGGYDRGIDLLPLARSIQARPSIKKVVIIGQVRLQLAKLLRELGFDNFVSSDALAMRDIVKASLEYASPGDVVLLSPGCASFDMFENFSERGNVFKAIVKALDE